MFNFTFQSYQILLKTILSSNWQIITLENDDESSQNTIILRHDVDRKPQNALSMAKLEASLGIRSSYYF